MKTKEKILKEIFDNDPMEILDKPFTTNEKLYNMNTLIQQIADKCVDEIDEHIDNTIHWQLNFDDDDEGNELIGELELKIKQQILFSLIKRVTQ
tara:strand:+ start:491 stop:772 length:282 start_codon:yes stop_codon:yes gene_type:complete